MSALVAALFKDHATADQVRTALVSDGFPTDRVQLTSPTEPGPAALNPADTRRDQLREFFAQLFPEADESENVRTFVEGVRNGNAAVVVHPRGDNARRPVNAARVSVPSSSDPAMRAPSSPA